MDFLVEDHLEIAVVDDDPIFLEITTAMLSTHPDLRSFSLRSGDELLKLLEQRRIDCVILDHNLENETGLAVKHRMDGMQSDAPPVVMLTGAGRERVAIEAFRLGVTDYIRKTDLEPKVLLSSITNAVAKSRQRQREKAELAQALKAASLDPLTGLMGRADLEARLVELSGCNIRESRNFMVISFEFVEHYLVSQHFGEEISDMATRVFARRVQELAAASDICGRYSPSTFVIVKEMSYDVVDLTSLHERLEKHVSISLDTPLAPLKISAKVTTKNCCAVERDLTSVWSQDTAMPLC